MVDEERTLRVAVGGASGLVGTALSELLRERGDDVVPLVRRSSRAGGGEIPWDPAGGEIDAAALEGFDAVVHLGGENIANGRWSAARKAAIRDSRLLSTRLLSQTIAGLKQPPHTLVCASATGYYGNRAEECLDEESPGGEGFLADLCREWEAATEPAREAGVRVVNLRIGMVLARHGGALPAMLPAFAIGLGGRIGSGRQFLSWITLTDLIGAIEFVLTTDALAGPVNAVAPAPVTNREFTRTLGRLLRRPTILPLPAFAVRILFGEMGQALLLGGHRVLPSRLLRAGFAFRHTDLESALRAELKQEKPGTPIP